MDGEVATPKELTDVINIEVSPLPALPQALKTSWNEHWQDFNSRETVRMAQLFTNNHNIMTGGGFNGAMDAGFAWLTKRNMDAFEKSEKFGTAVEKFEAWVVEFVKESDGLTSTIEQLKRRANLLTTKMDRCFTHFEQYHDACAFVEQRGPSWSELSEKEIASLGHLKRAHILLCDIAAEPLG